jgi:hypothetical protein
LLIKKKKKNKEKQHTFGWEEKKNAWTWVRRRERREDKKRETGVWEKKMKT